jgi:hypothetical protein
MPLGAQLCSLGLFYVPWGLSARPSLGMHAPPSYACMPWGSYMSLVGSIMPLGALLCPLGRKCTPSLCVRPLYVYALSMCTGPPPRLCVPPQPFAPPSQAMHAPSMPCVLPHCRSPRVRPVDLFEVLPWKSTSPLPMPCQPTILTRDKTYKRI